MAVPTQPDLDCSAMEQIDSTYRHNETVSENSGYSPVLVRTQ